MSMFKGFKKVAEDKKTATMASPKGHKIVLVKSALRRQHQRALKSLPLYQASPEAPVGESADSADLPREGYFPMSQEQLSAPPANPIGAGNGLPEAQSPSLSAPQGMLEQFPGFKEAENALNLQSQAQQEQSQSNEQAIASHLKQQVSAQQQFDEKTKDLLNQIQDVTQDIHDGHIDPNHYMDSMGSGKKIGTAIGLLLSGLGSGLSGQDNMAMKFLNSQIERDLSAQKDNLNNKHNLLSALQKQFGDTVTAENMFRAIRANTLADHISMAAAKAGTQTAISNAAMAKSQLIQQYFPLVKQAAAMQLTNGIEGNGTGPGGSPATDQYLKALRQIDPQKAGEIEKRYVPSVGVASIPVPDKAREELVNRQDLHNALSDLKQFAEAHQGTVLDRAVVNEGLAKSALVQDQYRRANSQGVFREAEKSFVESILSKDPTAFFADFRTSPRYKAAIQDNLAQLNSKRKSYGLPEMQAPTEKVLGPDGKVRLVPPSLIDAAIKAGGKKL